MTDILLHDHVKNSVQALVASRPHAILITGDLGAGKRTVARFIAEQALNQSLESSPYYTEIYPEPKAISIDQIRSLAKFTQLKTTGKGTIRRVGVILSADAMTTEAQNALLKILEEPPADTMLLLTASHVQSLLPTIQSRVQQLHVHMPTRTQTIDFFIKQGKPGKEIDKVYSIANGQVGLVNALLNSQDDHALVQQIDKAKTLLQQGTFEKLIQIDALAKQKDDVPLLLYALKRIVLSALEQAAAKGDTKTVAAWHARLESIVAAEQSLDHNPNTKLLLTDLFLHL